MALQDGPQFFRCYTAEYDREHMVLPDLFVSAVGSKLKAGNIQLIGPSGNGWKLKLESNTHGVYLTEGWQSFVDEMKIKEGDFLLFHYDNNKTFNVIHYDDTGHQINRYTPPAGSSSGIGGAK